MGTPLRNITAILSPKFLSPLAGKHLNPPRSEGKGFLESNHNKGVKRKLNFCQLEKCSKTQILENWNKNTVPLIKVEHFDQEKCRKSIVEINTPNKKDLLKSGLDNFTCKTDILGKGKFGTVFRASCRGLSVAVKLIKNSKTHLKEENALFLNHKNIVKTIEIIKNPLENYSLILMEYLPNCKDLQYILENLQNVSKLWKKFAIDIASGLKFCHDNGVIHLDLKPKNILVDGVVCKICDFGNSVRIGEDLQNFRNNGTAIYTAPELLSGKPPTTKCDIYSLGVIFGQMKFGKTPFDGMENLECIIYNVGKKNLKPFSDLAVETFDSFTQLVKLCLSSNPGSRPDCQEVLRKLETISIS